MRPWLAITLAALVAAWAAPALAGPPLPLTPQRPVVDRYGAVEVTDPYRWLEDWSDPAVRAWSDSQTAVARAFLDSLPMRRAVLGQVESLTEKPAPAWFGVRRAGDLYFALKNDPPKQQPVLVSLRSLTAPTGEKVLVDPNALDPSGATTIDFFEPSRDGARVAVSLSQGGTESGTVQVWETATGRQLSDQVPRVNGGTAGGSVAWNADGTGFWRTRYPAAGERAEEDLAFYQQVYFHRLGTAPEQDTYVIGRDFPKIAEVLLQSSDDGRWVLADVLNGDGGDHAMWLAAQADGAFRPLSTFADRVVGAAFGSDTLFLLSRKGSPAGQVLRLALPAGTLDQAKVVVQPPADEAGIESFTVSGDVLYVEQIVGGPSRVFAVTTSGQLRGLVPLPNPCTVEEMARTTGGGVALSVQQWTAPRRWVTYVPGSRQTAPTALATRPPVSFDDIEVKTVRVVSKDGTLVPLTFLMRRGTPLDGSAPTLLYGYGGYAISQRPAFAATRRVWFDQGGVYAVAHIRGGGEFGDAWHEAGKLTRKQNGFDDFYACACWLVNNHVTSPAKLACMGGSNGGILMGAMLTQHPETFHAVVSSVGVYDMLRNEGEANGQFNVTEYGTVQDPEQFAALYAYSPYHRVVDGTHYPAVLLPTGANDPRVNPMNSRKFAARLQAASVSGLPILLRAEKGTGHVGTPLKARNEQSADIYSFLFAELGVKWKAPAAAPAAPAGHAPRH
jgi:prolyl oligopeptidase